MINEKFSTMLLAGKVNSLGWAEEVVEIVITDKTRLPELYQCLFEDDSWLRMRASDALEKVCRRHPEWFVEYLPRLFSEMAQIDQPSVKWHLAQMLGEIELNQSYQEKANAWLINNISSVAVDWIVSANTMVTLVGFAQSKKVEVETVRKLLHVQTKHKSKAVVKKAQKLLAELDRVS